MSTVHVQALAYHVTTIVDEGDTPPPTWYAVFRGGLDGTQYAKGWYAERRNPVMSYADIDFYF